MIAFGPSSRSPSWARSPQSTPSTFYLIVAALLYLTALSIAIGVLLPNTDKLLRLVANSSPPAGASAGPPPQVMSLIRSSQVFGGVATLLFLVIIFLMIIQPGGIVVR